MAFELNRPDIRRAGIDADADEEDDAEDADATGANGLAPGVDDRLVLLPPGDVCALTGGDSGDVDGKLENMPTWELVTPDDPLPDAAITGESVLAPPMPPGDACFDGAEKALGEDRLDDPPLPVECPDIAIGVTVAPCGGWNEGVAMPCVDDELAEGECCNVAPGLVAVLSFAFLLGSVAIFGKGPPGRFLLLSPPPPLPRPPLPLPPLLPPALNIGPPEAPGSRVRKKTLASAFQATPVDAQNLKSFDHVARLITSPQ